MELSDELFYSIDLSNLSVLNLRNNNVKHGVIPRHIKNVNLRTFNPVKSEYIVLSDIIIIGLNEFENITLDKHLHIIKNKKIIFFLPERLNLVKVRNTLRNSTFNNQDLKIYFFTPYGLIDSEILKDIIYSTIDKKEKRERLKSTKFSRLSIENQNIILNSIETEREDYLKYLEEIKY